MTAEVLVQGKLLSTRNHCVWGENRSAMRNGKSIPTSKVTIEFDHASVCGVVKLTDPASKEFEFHFKQ